MISLPFCASATVMSPISDLPAATRSARVSIPCVTALRSVCSSGAIILSSTSGRVRPARRRCRSWPCRAPWNSGERAGTTFRPGWRTASLADAHQFLLEPPVEARLRDDSGIGIVGFLGGSAVPWRRHLTDSAAEPRQLTWRVLGPVRAVEVHLTVVDLGDLYPPGLGPSAWISISQLPPQTDDVFGPKSSRTPRLRISPSIAPGQSKSSPASLTKRWSGSALTRR